MKEKIGKIYCFFAGLLSMLFKKVLGKSEASAKEQLFLKDISLLEWSKDEKRDFEMRVRKLQHKAEIVLKEIEIILLKLPEIPLALTPFYRRELEMKLMQGDSVWEVAQSFFNPYQYGLCFKFSDETVKKLAEKFSELTEKGFLTANLFTKEEGGDRSKLFPWEEQYIELQERT